MTRVPIWVIMVPGVLMIEIALWQYGHLGSGANPGSFVWPNVFRGVGLAFLFPPLMTMALSTLPRPMLATGAAISSMIGQLGGSIGIATLATILQRSQQIHHAYLTTSNITENRVQTLVSNSNLISHLTSLGIPLSKARELSAGIMESQIAKQALMLSFNDIYEAVAIAAIILLAPIFLFERRKDAPG